MRSYVDILRIWIAKLIMIYYLRVLKIQTHTLTCNETGELLFIGTLQKTDNPQMWVVEKIFYNNYPEGIKVGSCLQLNFNVPTDDYLNA